METKKWRQADRTRCQETLSTCREKRVWGTVKKKKNPFSPTNFRLLWVAVHTIHLLWLTTWQNRSTTEPRRPVSGETSKSQPGESLFSSESRHRACQVALPKRNLENEKSVQEGRHGKQMAEAACVCVWRITVWVDFSRETVKAFTGTKVC